MVYRFEPVSINGKNYTTARTTPEHIAGDLHGIGVGSIITIRLNNDINPQVIDFVKNDPSESQVEPFELPEACPFCEEPTELIARGKTRTLKCNNDGCWMINAMKLMNFF
jgi:NAD-dependent DNA ligase